MLDAQPVTTADVEAPTPAPESPPPILNITFEGKTYRLRLQRIDDAKVWRYQVEDGPPGGYLVTKIGRTVVCSCPDYCFRRAGNGEPCKHGQAALQAGLL